MRLKVGLSRFIRVPDPPKEPTWNRPIRLLWRIGSGSSSPENDSEGLVFGFPPLKPEKPEPIEFRSKFPEFGKKTQIPVIFFQIPTLFPLDPMKFWLDLTKSHRIWWDFHRIYVFSIVFSPSQIWPTCLLLVNVLNRLTRLLQRVDSGLGTNSTWTNPWTALVKGKRWNTQHISEYQFSMRWTVPTWVTKALSPLGK